MPENRATKACTVVQGRSYFPVHATAAELVAQSGWIEVEDLTVMRIGFAYKGERQEVWLERTGRMTWLNLARVDRLDERELGYVLQPQELKARHPWWRFWVRRA